MRFAFSSINCPQWNLDQLTSTVRELGYDGLELHAAVVNGTDAQAISRAAQGIPICCLASDASATGRSQADRDSGSQIIALIDKAAEIGCKRVKVCNVAHPSRHTAAGAMNLLSHWLLPLADRAAERGVRIVVENAPGLRTARQMWLTLETLAHPAIENCWDVFHAATAGEFAAISVPTLNSRIDYVQLKDATLARSGAAYASLGQGHLRVRDLVHRLQGIGYNGFVCFELQPDWAEVIADPRPVLAEALVRLREWTMPAQPQAPAKAEKPKPAPRRNPAESTTTSA